MSEDAVSYCERFLELLTDLEAQLPSRRFFNTLLSDSHLVVRKVHQELDLYMLFYVSQITLQVCCYLSNLVGRQPEGHLFKQVCTSLTAPHMIPPFLFPH